VQLTLTRDPAARAREALRRAAVIVATTVLDAATLPDRAVIATYHAQSAVARGLACWQDPLVLASSVFVKQPHRIMALACIMVLCLLVDRLAAVRVRARLAATPATVPDPLRRPTTRPTMRWLFQCFEGSDVQHLTWPDGARHTQVLRLNAVHRLVLRRLGPAYEVRYLLSRESAK
jgi:transposase